jgi:GNAT superfamily N-acetyltransferase
MLSIHPVDLNDKSQVNRFIQIPYQINAGNPNWVPPIIMDVKTQLNKKKHPYFEHSDGEFFMAEQNGRAVGRLAVFENKPYNTYHSKKQAHFYFFESEQDLETTRALFDRAFEWARARGLTQIVGPKGLGPLDGYGIQVEGFEHRQMMTMMNYNPPYYATFLEELGFRKEVDFVSCYLNANEFQLPDRIHSIAERVQQRGTLRVHRFKSKQEMLRWAKKIGDAYNKSFVNNWEYYPLTEREINFVVSNILTIAVPSLIKIIVHDEDVVGFLFGFPDVSAALQRSKGRLFPFGIVDLLLEMRRTNWIALNGTGILPEFQGRGGNALMYSEMEKTIKESGRFQHADLTQVAESAVNMRSDLKNVGGQEYKNHRVYIRDL